MVLLVAALHRIRSLFATSARAVLAAAALLFVASCGYSTGLSVRVLGADKQGADRVLVEAMVDGAPIKCGEQACQNVVPALAARPLQATEDVRIVLDPDLGGKVVTVNVSLLKEGVTLAQRAGMGVVEKEYTKVVVVDFGM